VPEQRIQISLPPDQLSGEFADFVRAWHTKDCFVLDFSSFTEPAIRDEASGDLILNATIVSRVRIPPSQVFELMKALEQQLSLWEKEQTATNQR
jgi:hypothetical protein